MKRKYFIITILTAALLLCFCAGAKKSVQVDQDDKDTDIVFIEDFDPMSLGDDQLELKPRAGDDNLQDIDQWLKGEQENGTSLQPRLVPGFRVQLIASRNETEARSVRREAILKFDEGIYLIFDNPYYKVRVGDCQSRFEANTLQEMALNKGFLEAWVVRTSVLTGNETF